MEPSIEVSRSFPPSTRATLNAARESAAARSSMRQMNNSARKAMRNEKLRQKTDARSLVSRDSHPLPRNAAEMTMLARITAATMTTVPTISDPSPLRKASDNIFHGLPGQAGPHGHAADPSF